MSHRFFVSADAIDGGRASLRGEQARQIATVLRLAPGERVVLVAGGEELEASLERVDPREVEAAIVERRAPAAEPRVALTLALPILKGDRTEEVIEAVTQLGVSALVPYVSARSVVREAGPAKRRRWEKVAREAAETSRRGRVPGIAETVEWARLFDVLPAPIVVAWERERDRALTDALAPSERLSLVVGPEGGLEEAEVVFAREHGAVTASLGRRSLRSEAAAIAAVAVAMSILDR